MSIWLLFPKLIVYIAFFITTFVDLTIIIITVLFIKRKFGCYKYLIILFEILGIIFALLDFLVHPILHSYNNGYIFFSSSVDFDQQVTHTLIMIFAGMYSAIISLIAVQFIYRYWAVFHVEKLRNFKSWKILFWIGYITLFGISNALGMHFFGMFDDFSLNYMRGMMMEFYSVNISEVPGISVVVYDAENHIRWFNNLYAVNTTIMISIQYCVMIYTGTAINSRMDNVIHVFSPPLQRLNRQIFKTLVIQIIAPTLFLFIPVLVTIFIPFLQLDINFPSGILTCSFGLYPAFDAFILVFIVSDYHKALKGMYRSLQNTCRTIISR